MRAYDPDEIEKAYDAWLPQLENALKEPLGYLARKYKEAVDSNSATNDSVDQLVEQIREAAKFRNVLCHGSWGSPDNKGASLPFFVDKKMRIFETRVDIAFLKQLRAHVTELIFDIMDSVTRNGWQFPGSNGPGESIWKSKGRRAD